MYTIFKNDASIILTDNTNMLFEKDYFLWKEIRLNNRLDELLSAEQGQVILFDEDLDMMWKEFGKHFKIIEAAGGIVENETGEILFILRNGIWDLPKGKIEKNESKEEAGLREVEEECGFTLLDLGHFIGTTYHVYDENEVQVLKISYWFSMTSDQKDLKPQLEEGITALKWAKKEELNFVYNNTYPNISLLIDMYKASFQ